jgi:hypothetical protein
LGKGREGDTRNIVINTGVLVELNNFFDKQKYDVSKDNLEPEFEVLVFLFLTQFPSATK